MNKESNRWDDAEEQGKPRMNIDWTKIVLYLIHLTVGIAFFLLFFKTDFFMITPDKEKRVDTVYIEVPVEKDVSSLSR